MEGLRSLLVRGRVRGGSMRLSFVFSGIGPLGMGIGERRGDLEWASLTPNLELPMCRW